MAVDVKPWALSLISGVRTEFTMLMTQIPDEQRHLVGEMKQWSPKDEIAHLTYWIELFVANLQACRANRPLINTQNYLAMNDLAWVERSAWTWIEVEHALAQVLADLQIEIETLSSQALVDPQCFTLEPARKSPRPLLRNLLYEVIDHPLHHFVGLYDKFGNTAQKRVLLERTQQRLKWPGTSKWTETTRRKIRTYTDGTSSR
jgi:hypothetical protein